SLIKYYKSNKRDVCEYNQSHKTIYEQTEAVGHAVRATYLYTAMADYAREYKDDRLFKVCQALWENVCKKKMYITGGVGSVSYIEGFGQDYYLPDKDAYAETCAAIGLVFWAQRMLQIECNRKYSDVIERVLYNIIPASVSLDGKQFFYGNPLMSSGNYKRFDKITCACCPPNVIRLFASLGQYIYSANQDDIAVHLYVKGSTKININGTDAELVQDTDYPWNGRVLITLNTKSKVKFKMKLRIPGWCRNAIVKVNGELFDLSNKMEDGYAVIDRSWKDKDNIELIMEMPVETIRAHPNMEGKPFKIALQRGPLVYCLESIDNLENIDNNVDLEKIRIPSNTGFSEFYDSSIPGGIIKITCEGELADDASWGEELYTPGCIKTRPFKVTAVPYCVWGNRGVGQMIVWINAT
ncbi:MAG: glycoside hydrolase family 127 protein, partial [Clostridiaceae bacterium]|nr:glycoside hydrolase family 127 protein [Clostridiaceae bacterium]